MQEELQDGVRNVLRRIPDKDKQALAMVFLEEQPRMDVCGELGVTEPHLRVILHRAKSQFRRRYTIQTDVGERMAA